MEEALRELQLEAEKPKLIGNPEGLDPSKHYAWILKENIRTRQYEGYEVVKSKSKKVNGVYEAQEGPSTIGLQADGTHVLNDTVLMCCPKEAHDKKLRLSAAKSILRLQGSREGVLRKAQELGIPASPMEE